MRRPMPQNQVALATLAPAVTGFGID